MSEIWSVIPDEMVSREPCPRILKDLQDITGKLLQEFSNSGEPITDDNTELHRLCVKLEYLLQTCMRDRSIIGGSKHYWHWMYDSLKRTKRLSDGLRFVQANKEVRTSQGRGRALIRYSLVHQTLADSFQNCLMNKSTCTHYLKPMCILVRSHHIAVFLNALYEINAVHFDLMSKGYDLDTSWPTFASKRFSPGTDQWRLGAGRTSSLGSLGSYVSNIMTLPENNRGRGLLDYDSRGTVSSGPPSVDQRVEELVLELDESDHRIKKQKEDLERLESEATTAAKSATEEKEILARTISDLQSKNLDLQEAMSQMSTEFQIREESWEMKYNQLERILKETEEINLNLKDKISVLEEDKRNLEDTVSARMSRITSAFSGTNFDSISPATSMDDIKIESRESELKQKLTDSENEIKNLEDKVSSLRFELAAFPKRLESEKKALTSSLMAKFESEEAEWKRKVDVSLKNATDSVLSRLASVLPNGYLTPSDDTRSPNEKVGNLVTKLAQMVEEVSELRRTSTKLQKENLVQQTYQEERENEAAEMISKLSAMQQERDDAIGEMENLSEQLMDVNKELQNFRLQHEAVVSDHQRNMLELKDTNFHLQEAVEKEQLAQNELKEECHLLQLKCDDISLDLKNYKQRCSDLQEEMQNSYRDRDSFEPGNEKTAEMSKTIADLEATISRLTKEAQNDEKLRNECVEENQRLSDLVETLTEKLQNLDTIVETLNIQIDDLTSSIEALKEEKNLLADELSIRNEVASKHELETELLSSTLGSVSQAVENTEKQYEILTESLSRNDYDLTVSHMSTIKACIDAERSMAKKEYDELTGENESRKRMIISLEGKLQLLKEENDKLTENETNLKELKDRLDFALEERDTMKGSFVAMEQECIKMAERLEKEREESLALKNEVSQSLAREYDLKQSMEDLRSVNKGFKEKMEQLLQEKDALWKECDELKYFQKLDEEGDNTKSRWMEDQEAKYCLRCGTEFSFIIRKHHCRICGKIFCSDCSKQWIITKADGKHERCCVSCLERHRDANEIRALTSSVAASETQLQSSPIKGNRLLLDDTQFDTISEEELSEAKTAENSAAHNSSLYVTPDSLSGDISRDSLSSIPYDNEDLCTKVPCEKETSVAAGEVLKVPVEISKSGMILTWKFSTDRSIDFQLSYSACKEDDDQQALIPLCRCNSHSEPVQGELVSKESGIYTFEFDNRFSRLMPKSVKYILELKEVEE